MKWGRWSTTAASNSATPPDGWPEGQAPSTVNDCAREMMAQIRTGISNIQFVDLDLSPTQTGNTTFTVPGNQMQYFEYGRRLQFIDGANTYYGSVYSSTYTTNTGISVRLDSGLLDVSLSAVAIGFPSVSNGAGPDNGIQRIMNPIVNGAIDFWQRGTAFSFSAAQAQTYCADRWFFTCNLSAGGGMIQQFTRASNASNVPTLAQSGMLFNNAIGVSVSAACASLASTNFGLLGQCIEGYKWRNFAQKPLTISFWVNSNLTGTYCVAFRNTGLDRACVLEYSISSASTWEKKTLTFPKSPTTGTWDYSNGTGLAVLFMLGGGSSFQQAAGSWSANNGVVTTNQKNFFATAGNVFKICGVQLDEGNVAMPFRPIDPAEELVRISRYWQQGTGVMEKTYSTIGNFTDTMAFPGGLMRSTPAVGFASTTGPNSASASILNTFPGGFYPKLSLTGPADCLWVFTWSASAELS
jgi:hypothetical protein